MADNKQHNPAEVVAKPDVMLRIKLGNQIYETLSNNLDYQTFMDRLREIYPAWDNSSNYSTTYEYPQQALPRDSNVGAEYRMLGAKSWEAMWWQVRRAGYDTIDFEIRVRSTPTIEEPATPAPPAYTK